MAGKTYPVAPWVRTVICLSPFVLTGSLAIVVLVTGRGHALLVPGSVLCAAVIKRVLSKQ